MELEDEREGSTMHWRTGSMMTRLRLTAAAGAAALVCGLVGASSASAAPYTIGNVLAGVGNGQVKEFTPAGVLVQTLDTTTNSTFTTGGCFDSNDNFYTTLFNATQGVSKFGPDGALVTPGFGSGYNSDPESCAVDQNDNVFVGQADGAQDILKFDSAGNPIGTFDVPTGPRGTDWIDLAEDQCTIFYTSEGDTIRRFNTCTNTALGDFIVGLPGNNCYALRIRENGEVLVACTSTVHRLGPAGNMIMSYTVPGANTLFAMNLDQDGTTFWTADLGTGDVNRFNIETGAQVGTTWNANPNTSLAGLNVVGEFRAGASKPKCNKVTSTIAGTNNADTINGGTTRDVVQARGGNDTVRSDGGNDLVCGGEGKDKLTGGAGKDKMFGDAGNDSLKGNKGKDNMHGGAGNDFLRGGGKKDKMFGEEGNDRIRSRGDVRDRVNCGPGKKDVAIADFLDKVKHNCEKVKRAES